MTGDANGAVRERAFHLFFILFSMAVSLYSSFINLYLKQLGYTTMAIGLFSAIAALLSSVFQPGMGLLADRARTKNRVMGILFAAQIGTTLLFLWHRSWLIAPLMTVWTVFQASVMAISTSILLEHLHVCRQSERYGRIRLSYSLGFGIAGGVFGWLLKDHISGMFLYSAVVGLLALLFMSRLPKVKGKQRQRGRSGFSVLFRYRQLLLVLAAGLLVSVSNSFSLSFLPLYFDKAGGSVGLYGWSVFLMAFAEAPFLLLSGRLIRRFGTLGLLWIPASAQGVRCILAALFPAPWVLLLSQVLHGLSFIVVYIAVTQYIACTVCDELSASGQMLASIVILSLARVLGNLGGGVLSDLLGMDKAFLVMGLLSLAALPILPIAIRMKPGPISGNMPPMISR